MVSAELFRFEFLLWPICAVLPVTLHLYESDSRLENFTGIFLSGLGRRLPRLSDSGPVSVFPGEINLKILFANWPSSSNCQLLLMQYQTEMYEVTPWFSSSQTAFRTFRLKILPRAFQAVTKTIWKVLSTSSWHWKNPLIIFLGTDISEKWMNGKRLHLLSVDYVPAIRFLSMYLILKTVPT